MALADRIRAFLHPPAPAPQAARDLAVEVAQLRKGLEALEALQVDREIQWTETKDKLLRYLKRLQELDRRAGEDPENGATDSARRAAISRALEMKLPKPRG